jgi:UDP-N-acetylglucosamine--N-acetylmuramyl-(pentapeptide) pyrophosphoryl-undecaprenol N-acetylglucosamine transferase
MTRRPLVMHEQILTLGLANRILARLADRVLLSHESSIDHLPARAKARAVVTGNPIRPEILSGNRNRALAAYHLDPRLPLVYVTGGAQGAVQVNNLVADILPGLLPRCQVLHQCGDFSLDRMRQVADAVPEHLRSRYRVVDYVHGELPDVLSAADIVVARSGAGTVAELTALGKACVFIPLIPTGGDEQRRTARHLADAGASRMLAGPDASANRLYEEIMMLLDHPERRQELANAARQHGRPRAAAAVASAIIDAAGRARS